MQRNSLTRFQQIQLDTTMLIAIEPKKSVVQVYFPSRGMNLAYYNDSFDLKVGDLVYVDGKLEGHRGQVTEVNYSFKIKLSDYGHNITSHLETVQTRSGRHATIAVYKLEKERD